MDVLYQTLRAQMRMASYYYWAALGIGILLFLLLRREKMSKRVAISLAAAYLFLVLSSTVFRRRVYVKRVCYLVPFRYLKVILRRGLRKSKHQIAQIVLNILLISPMGFLMPVFMKKRWVIVSGFCFSLFIEGLQLFLRRGCFEVDDIICNTLGVILACGIVRLIELCIARRKRHRTSPSAGKS